MYKDIVISLLGALLLEPVFKTTEVGEQIAMVMGLAAMLFIFCLFCEIQAEKMAGKAPEGTEYGAEDSDAERRRKA
mgnify:CR=1 FL=1